MAKLFPELKIIKKMNPAPTEGELELLEYFDQTTDFDDSWEIYFQPWLNGLHADIVMLRKKHGVYVIEVKDWDLDIYNIKDTEGNDSWLNDVFVYHNNEWVNTHANPFRQVKKYKDALYEMYSLELLESKIKSNMAYAMVIPVVYLTFSDKIKRHNFFHNFKAFEFNYYGIPYINHKNTNSYFVFGRDDLLDKSFSKTLCSGYMGNLESKIFKEDHYNSLKALFNPSEEEQEQSNPIFLSKEQEYAIRGDSKSIKINGVAGAGKTVLIAYKAIQEQLRTKKPILILTFNITLKNYIRDKIKRVYQGITDENITGKEINKKYHIIHYHAFRKYYETEVLLSYGAILIDEIQDWEQEWIYYINLIKYNKDTNKVEENYASDFEKRDFKLPNIFYFGDAKQNIYNRELENKQPRIPMVRGQWRTLKESQRLSGNIIEFANSFMNKFLSTKYEVETMYASQGTLFDSNTYYITYKNNGLKKDTNDKYLFIYQVLQYAHIKKECPINDICILFNTIEEGRKSLQFFLDIEKDNPQNFVKYNFTRTFETQDEYTYLLKQKNLTDGEFKYYKKEFIDRYNLRHENSPIITPLNYKTTINKYKLNRAIIVNNILRKKRNSLKYHFWMNTGKIKLSTIHSFKGWELPNIILILDNTSTSKAETLDNTLDELVYTSITRARANLFIVEIDEGKYTEFFKEHSKIKLNYDNMSILDKE